MGDAIGAAAESFITSCFGEVPQEWLPFIIFLGVLVLLIFVIIWVLLKHEANQTEKLIQEVRKAYESAMQSHEKVIAQLLKERKK